MIDQYLKYYKLDAEAIKFLQDNIQTITASLPEIIDKFYENMVGQPVTGKILRGQDITRLKKAQLDHWHFAITSGLSADYVKRVERLGVHMKRLVLPPFGTLVAIVLLSSYFPAQ